MRLWNRFVLPMIALAICVAAAPAADKETTEYLTDKGELRESLVLRSLQSGTKGQTGPVITIEKDGSWRLEKQFGRKLTAEKSGKLTKTELTTLAKELAKYDLATLKNEGKLRVNPRTIQIVWGDRNVTLYVTTPKLPEPDAKTLVGRYTGIAVAVNAAIKGDK